MKYPCFSLLNGATLGGALLLWAGVSLSSAQSAELNLPKPDPEGWITLFRGDNTSDFYTLYEGGVIKTFPDAVFSHKGDTIVGSGVSPVHIVFKQKFSHYHVRYQMHFPNDKFGNCGMLIHLQDKDSIMWGRFPRSIESQGDPGQGMGQIWCISRVWVTVKANTSASIPVYNPASPEVDWGAKDDNTRVIAGKGGWATPKLTPELNQKWTTQEADVHGSDSISHIVNGETVIHYRNPRVAPRDNPNKVEKYLKDGLLAWQSEGVPIYYRNIQIKLYPEDPLYAKLYAPSAIAFKLATKPRKNSALVFHRGILSLEPVGQKSSGELDAPFTQNASFNLLGKRPSLKILP